MPACVVVAYGWGLHFSGRQGCWFGASIQWAAHKGVCETASTFGRDQPCACNPRRKALVGEVILWQVGCTSSFRHPTVLSTPLFAYNHQEALLVRSKAAHALIRASRGPFWTCLLQISMQMNKQMTINSQIPLKKQPHTSE